jgi:hypothetical protein
MVLNPAGYQPVLDYGAPQIISGRAREAISGGQLVYLSGTTGVTSSGVNSFDPTADFLFATNASGTQFTGVAVANAGSNESVSVATNGCLIITAAGAINATNTVTANGGHAVVAATTAGQVIGRALTSAGSEGYTIVQLGRN